MTTEGEKVKGNLKKIYGEKMKTFSLFSLSLSLSLPLNSAVSVEAPLQVRAVHPLQRHHKRRSPQRQPFLLRHAPQVPERRRHRLVEPFLHFLDRPPKVLDVLDPLEERDGDSPAASILFFGWWGRGRGKERER